MVVATVPDTLTVPETAWVAGKFPTETEPETGCVAGKLLTLTEPETAWVAGKFPTETEPETGWVAGKLPTLTVPETGWVAGKLPTLTVPETGCVVVPTGSIRIGLVGTPWGDAPSESRTNPGAPTLLLTFTVRAVIEAMPWMLRTSVEGEPAVPGAACLAEVAAPAGRAKVLAVMACAAG